MHKIWPKGKDQGWCTLVCDGWRWFEDQIGARAW